MNENELYFKDAFTLNNDNINLEVNKLEVSCIASNNNSFTLDNEGNLTVKSIQTTDPAQLELNQEAIIDIVYPIGSIYLSVNSTNPSTVFGGTWIVWGAGRAIVGMDISQSEFNTVEKIGGSKYTEEHYHDVRYYSPTGSGVTISYTGTGADALNVSNWSWQKNITNEFGSSSNLSTNKFGTGTSGNLQPYITCYIWKRIA